MLENPKRLTTVSGRYPDFIIIGAARSGTTTLATVLSQHPQIFMCDPKEPFFFSHESARALGETWYCSLFARCRRDQICGEASTSYSVWPECDDVAGRIARSVPHVKLIYIMRHPVDRAYSHYDYDTIRLGMRMTFEEAIEQDDRFVNVSMYMQQIRQYLRHFNRDSFLFLLFDDLVANCEDTVSQITEFLRVSPLEPSNCRFVANSGDEHYVRMHTTQKLRSIPGVSRLADGLPRSWRDFVFRFFKRSPGYRLIARRHKLPVMHRETRQRLLNLFEKPNHELAEFLNRDLSAWST